MASTVGTSSAARPAIPRPRLWDALNERLALSSLAYPVPDHANSLPYVLGGITFFGFLVLIVSGVFLAQFYHPHPDSAHTSVIYIITQAPFGDLVRSVHFWTANLVTLTVLLHMLRVFVTASYKRPREVNWLVGVGLLAVTLGFVFTGTVLKWDQESVEALGHNIEIGQLLGSWGAWFTNEFTLSVPILTRLFIGHVTMLPAAFTVLIIAHIYLIKQLGISPKAAGDAQSGPPSAGRGPAHFTEHLQKMAGYGFLLLAIVLVLALFAPAPLGNAGVPGAEVTKPPWMFLPIYPLEDVLGIRGLLIGAMTVIFLLVVVPFVDRSPWLSPRRRKWIIVIGALILVALIISGGYAWFSRPEAHLMENVP
jgi:ubiquinol-cytochrome c reductase cytochrome b subunit